MSAGAVAVAGVRLARDGDAIALRTGLGGVWVGAIAVAAATSLPELTTDLYAVRDGHPNLAVGDLFGSGLVNMVILAAADLLSRNTRVLTRVAVNQGLVGTLAICLIALATTGVVAGGGAWFGLGWATALIAFLYLLGMRVIHTNRAAPPFLPSAEATRLGAAAPPIQRTLPGFMAAALVILVAAGYLAGSAAGLAEELGVSRGVVGVVFLALTTSLPEVVVSITSIRQGAYDLAVGNLLGSNCFNMAILLPLDLVEGPGSLLTRVEPSVLIAGLFSIVLTGLALLESLNRSEHRVRFLEPGPFFMLLLYALSLYLSVSAGAT